MNALVVVNLAGFLAFLWEDIITLQRLGYTVSVATNGKLSNESLAIEISKLSSMNIKYYQIDFDNKNPISKRNLTAYFQIKKILNNEYDLIHCHTSVSGLLTRLAAIKYWKRGCKIIYTSHGFPFTDTSSVKSWILYYYLEKFASRFCDSIVTINSEDYNNAKKMYCKNVYKISGVGLDTNRFNSLEINRSEYRKSLSINDDDIMILAVGKLSELKNHEIIIKALGSLKDKEKYVFVICGETVVSESFDHNLINLAKQLNVRLRLLGHRSDIPELNKCADIAVLPSLREGLGMAGLEALASGCPIIGSNVQGIREYVFPGKTGYLCNPHNSIEFADAITKITMLSEKEKEIMSEECKRIAMKFDKSISIKQMEEIYIKLRVF